MAKKYFLNASIPKPPDLGSTPWVVRDLYPITVVFGKNGSGKSRLLRAWRDLDPNSRHYIPPERAGELSYDAQLFHSQLEASQRQNQSQRNSIPNYRQQIVSRIQAYFGVRGSVRGNQLPGDPTELEQLLHNLLPDFNVELIGNSSPPYRLKRASDGSQIGSVDQLSSGQAQVLILAMDIVTMAAIWDIQMQPTRLMLIDEPDAHIHPDLQVRFADFLVGVAKRFDLQVVVATHSTTLLAGVAQFGGDDAGMMYLDRTRNTFEVSPFDRYKKEIAACLGGHALMGPLFGVPLLIVEGDDDYRIWSQVPRHHQISLAVIPASGSDEVDQFQKNLEQLFESLRQDVSGPAGFALLDGDKAVRVPGPERPQTHIRFLGLNCHESENLYLTDEVLTELGTTWEKASSDIASAAPRFGAKTGRLADAQAWDRRTVNLKNLMNELIEILDPKKVHWTIRVARTIGESRPSGQLAEFLGEPVVTSIWGALANTEPEAA